MLNLEMPGVGGSVPSPVPRMKNLNPGGEGWSKDRQQVGGRLASASQPMLPAALCSPPRGLMSKL